ncbi:DUF4132 domain-containing protein [Planomonospora sp. ID67723]|uniref:DUF4132 domain-containing protein n=1 Tax=Planomonospora sp. ID67723 TaxID=2738134 RepID=UPI0018C36F8B|nr:DUF4132 domain-containing protein [Planomonospora sp. ID67723]MBG0828253.1 DUF4132 domain-containing protein [Planomonospora sp. ID67723]
MSELTATEAFVAENQIMELIARERALRERANPSPRPDDFDWKVWRVLSHQADQIQHEVRRRLRQAEETTCRAAAIRLAQPSPSRCAEELDIALSRSGTWSPAEMAALLTALRSCDLSWHDDAWLSLLLDRLLEFETGERAALRELVRPLIRAVAQSSIEAGKRRRLQRSITRILHTGPGTPLHALAPLDDWAAALYDHLGETPPEHLVHLLNHLGALHAPRPSASWRARCLELLRPADAQDLVRLALGAFDRVTEQTTVWDAVLRLIVSDPNVDTARGVVWAGALLGADDLVPVLSALAVRTSGAERQVREELRLAGAAINALGDCDDPAAVGALGRLQQVIRHRSLRKQIGVALAAAAGRAGLTPGQLLERSVPAHGLAADGTRSWRLDGHTVILSVADARTVRLSFTAPDGAALRTLPAALQESRADELAAVKAVRKEVRQTLAAERTRMEGLFTADRAWPYGEWIRHYRDHPITGVVARGLIWQADGVSFLGADLSGPGGRILPEPDEETRIRLWHPARVPPAEVTAWREEIAERRIRQLYKQAFREVYLLTPAEEDTRVYSNRFAAHIVDHPRLYALVKERGWQTTWLGPFDSGSDAEATRELAEGAWRARFHYGLAAVDAHQATLASTDQLRFDRRDGRAWRETELAEVPPLVFSEAMRDVDLFVAVTSIAADPQWTDRGEERYQDYWREASFGELPASAEVRRDALARLLPRLAVADRCTLTERYLVVRGDLRTYKIHLGSANVRMEPGDVYLCIVTAPKRGRLFLPFEDDERLTLILSKALLLADDRKITDESILRQIDRGLV